MPREIFISFFLWAMALAVVSGQSLPKESEFNRYTTRDGLPDNNILCLLQDRQGFLWAGTEAGLSCFDGVHFTNFYKGDNRLHSLPSNYIVNMVMLPSGNIVIATKFGLALLDPARRTFKSTMVPFEPGMEFIQNAIGSLELTSRGEIVAGNSAGIAVFDQELNLLYQYTHFTRDDLDKKQMGFAHDLLPLSNGDVIIKGWNGLWRYHSDRRKVDAQDARALGETDWQIVASAGKPDVSLTRPYFPDTLWARNYRTGALGKTILSDSIKYELHWRTTLRFVNDTLLGFAGCNNGIRSARFDPKTLSLKFSPDRIFDKVHFNQFLFDREGRWWLASENGLFGQSFSKKLFRFREVPVLTGKDGIPQNLTGITRMGNRFYVAQLTRILVFDGSLRWLKTIDLPKEYEQIVGIYNCQPGILEVWCNYGWKRLHVAEGSKNGGCWEPVGPPLFVRSQRMTRRREIWTGNRQGVLRYDTLTGRQTHFDGEKEEGGFPRQGALRIAETDSGYLWMCGTNGFVRWNPFSETFDRRYLKPPGTEGQEGFPCSMAGAGGETLLFSLWNNGLWTWGGGKEPARKLLPGNPSLETVFEIIPDASPQHFWLLSKSGVSYLDLPRFKLQKFSYPDGLPDETTMIDFYVDKAADSVYVCYQNGIAVGSRGALGFSENAVPVFITEVRQLSTGKLLTGVTDLRLPQPGNDLFISFGSPDFERGRLVTYAYRLNGGQWQDLGGNKSVRLANLAQGAYQFEVKSISSDGVSSPPARFSFSVKPRFYQTWWFVALMAAAVSLAFYGYFRWRLQQLRKMEALRQSIAADLHDEVGASLTSIQILSQLVRHPDPGRSGEALEKLPEQVRRTSAALREIVWNINPKNDDLDLLTGQLARQAGEVFEQAGIQYTVESDEFGAGAMLHPTARQHLVRIFREALNNLVKHSGAGRASLVFKNEKNALMMRLRDDGKGFDPGTVLRGNGLDNMRQRAEAADGKLELESRKGQGTEIILQLPLRNKKRWYS